MSDKIIIEFDDENKNEKKEEKIIIHFDNSIEENIDNGLEKEDLCDVDNVVVKEFSQLPKEEVAEKKVNNFFRGDQSLTGYFKSSLEFPEGIETGFRKNLSYDLKDKFLNSILETNKFIIIASTNGNVYFVDKRNKHQIQKFQFENESFEKTGVVIENVMYLNSLKNIYKFFYDEEANKIENKVIYSSENDFIIWSNMNFCDSSLVFIEYNPKQNLSVLKIFNTNTFNIVFEYKFKMESYLSDCICVANSKIYYLFDDKLLIISEGYSTDLVSISTNDSENNMLFFSNEKLFILKNEKIYYFETGETKIKYLGIKHEYITSIISMEDNIVLGLYNGWKIYKLNGALLYSNEEIHENKVECISNNILVTSNKNKIVFFNLNRFQEAESFTVASKSDYIISSIISDKAIYILTRNGILGSYTNDKILLNI